MQLEIEGLEAGYGKVTIVHGATLQADVGEVVTLLGPNGAGKSTLMKTLAGHLPSTAGEIRLDGIRIDGMGPYEIAMAGVGYVPQDNNVFGDLSVIENLEIAAMGAKGDLRAQINAVLDRFPILGERSRQKADTLSGGERQALAVSSALIIGTKLLLLDETAAGLAPILVEQMVQWVVELAEGGTTVIWIVEQNPEPILEISSRTYLMEGGQITRELDSSRLVTEGHLGELFFDNEP